MRDTRVGSALINNGRLREDRRETASNSGWLPKRSFGDIIYRGLGSDGYMDTDSHCWPVAVADEPQFATLRGSARSS
jgi:hypothetical protein